MKNLKKKIVAGVLGGMLMLSAIAGTGALSDAGEQSTTAKVNEYEGQHRLTGDAPLVDARKVNEYEGQF